MIRSRFALAVIAAVSLSLTACRDDTTDSTGPNDTGSLSAAEVADAFNALAAIGLFDFGLGGFQPAVLPVGLSAQSQSIDETEACPNGGNVRIRGNATYNQTTGVASADIRQAYNNCRSASSTGRVWTFNGNPDLRIQMNATANQATGQVSLTGGITGGFRYSSNGSSGSCSANVTIVGTANGSTVSGTMCGVNINDTF
jgi:hypothetical protein